MPPYPKNTKLVQALLTILIVVIVLTLLPVTTSAAPCPGGSTVLQIPIPGVGIECESGGRTVNAVTGLQEYISTFFNWFVGFIGLVSVVMIMIGGFMWLLAAGNSERIQAAKATIGGAISAILIVLISFTLFQTLNPDVVNLELVNVGQVSGGGGLLNAGVNVSGSAPVGAGGRSSLARFCRDAPAGSRVSYTNESGNGEEIEQPARGTANYESAILNYRCGDQTANIRQAGAGQTPVKCVGHVCPGNGNCLDRVGAGDPDHFICTQPKSLINGQISWIPSDKHLEGPIQLYAAYDDGRLPDSLKSVGNFDVDEGDVYYELEEGQGTSGRVTIEETLADNALVGYFIRAFVNDSDVFGLVDDAYGLDRTCRAPLETRDPETEKIIDPAGYLHVQQGPPLSAEEKAENAAFWKSVSGKLIQPEDFLINKSGGLNPNNIKTYTCNILIKGSLFPNR